jgi:uncharacterized protein YciI
VSSLAFVALHYRDRSRAAAHLEGHRAWLRDGVERGLVLVAGALDDDAGGALLVRTDDLKDLQRWVAADPFVVHGVVEAAITRLSPKLAVPELAWVMEDSRCG